MTKSPFLLTLLPSVDVDLGRWLMQHWKVDYVEHPHAPIFHILALLWHGLGADDYPAVIQGSEKWPAIEKMVEHFDPSADPDRRLVPDKLSEKDLHDEVMKLQHDFRWVMGAGTVDWAYFNLLPHKKLTWASFTTGVPWFEKLFLTFGYGVIKFLMMRGLHLNAAKAEQGLQDVYRGFEKVDALLTDGRKFLAGDRLTLADLAFATSGAPMVLANGYGGHLPTINMVPVSMQKVIKGLRARPSGAFIQRMYNEYR